MLTFRRSARASIGNWAIGGFFMAIGRGESDDYAGKKIPIYGLAESIM
ncbi:MAG: hypothetical protein HY038_09060 [Nitrospirae bacterium]|nr:hypothetical protein [Nitrospirota bacterium]